jgi:cyanobactin maturation PatA/PatG family protease
VRVGQALNVTKVVSSMSEDDQADLSLVYVIGKVGYDFGTEAHQDSFKQLMPAISDPTEDYPDGIPANPYDPCQMVEYLKQNPDEARALIWTLNLENIPIYGLEPVGQYGFEVYAQLIGILDGQTLAEQRPAEEWEDAAVECVAVAGTLSSGTVKLFSGHIVPIVEITQPHGLIEWPARSDECIEINKNATSSVSLREFITKFQRELLNHGTNPADRALNAAATFFIMQEVDLQAVQDNLTVQKFEVKKTPYAQPDADTWNVTLHLSNPENTQEAEETLTIDVSDTYPVEVSETDL